LNDANINYLQKETGIFSIYLDILREKIAATDII